MDTTISREDQLRRIPQGELEHMLEMLLQDKKFTGLYNSFLQKKEPPRQPSQDRMSFGTTGYCISMRPATREEAKDIFRQIMEKLKESDEFDWVPYMKKELSVIGKGVVMNYMLKYYQENAEAIAERIVTEHEDQLSKLLADREPLLSIEVREVTGKRTSDDGRPVDGSSRYTIHICNGMGKEKQILHNTKNADDLAIYLWFLLFPKEKWTLKRIFRNYDNLKKLSKHCFYSRDFTLKPQQPDEPDDFKNYKSRIKKSITDAVQDWDTPDWYILDREDNNIALPEDLITLPDSLVEFRDSIILVDRKPFTLH